MAAFCSSSKMTSLTLTDCIKFLVLAEIARTGTKTDPDFPFEVEKTEIKETFTNESPEA